MSKTYENQFPATFCAIVCNIQAPCFKDLLVSFTVINERLLFMKMRLRLPAIPGPSIFNAFQAVYLSCFHLVSVIPRSIIINFFCQKIHLSIKAGLIFSFRPEPQYTFETFACTVFRIHNVFKLKV